MKKNRWPIILGLLPLLGLFLLVVSQHHAQQVAVIIRVPAAGYDPRDVLRGHYVALGLAPRWQEPPSLCPDASDCVICVPAAPPQGWQFQPRQLAMTNSQCAALLEWDTNAVDQLSFRGLHFYAQQDMARDLDQLLRHRNREAPQERRNENMLTSNQPYFFPDHLLRRWPMKGVELDIAIHADGRIQPSELWIDGANWRVALEQWRAQRAAK